MLFKIWDNPLLSIDDRLKAAVVEINRLHTQIDEARKLLATRVESKRLDAAMDEIEELKKDKQRLDWLADRGNTIGNVQLPTVCVEANFSDMRLAIDAAMVLHRSEQL